MKRIDTLVIGGGQAGLAMSRCLSDRSIDHVVIERGRVAERWRSERWESLRLLTPNWQTRLPGFHYRGADPEGYMSRSQLIAFFDEYASSIAVPIESGTTVLSVEQLLPGFRVKTTSGTWRADHIVIATGYSDRAYVPPFARQLSPRLTQVVPSRYRSPRELPDGGVLVVGASATGVQLADEIHASGRAVTLAVGRHQRLPRTYRGRDIMWWFDAMGVLDATVDDVFDVGTSRRQPSLQLAGRCDVPSLDVGTLQRRGIRILGRLAGADRERAYFDDDLVATTSASDLKLAELRQRIDAFIAKSGVDSAVLSEPFEPTWRAALDVTTTVLDLQTSGIATVVWATGFTRRYPWLRVPVLDDRGDIRHRAGVTAVPGLFVLGMHFQRTRKSAFIDGVGGDAAVLADRIARTRTSVEQTRERVACHG